MASSPDGVTVAATGPAVVGNSANFEIYGPVLAHPAPKRCTLGDVSNDMTPATTVAKAWESLLPTTIRAPAPAPATHSTIIATTTSTTNPNSDVAASASAAASGEKVQGNVDGDGENAVAQGLVTPQAERGRPLRAVRGGVQYTGLVTPSLKSPLEYPNQNINTPMQTHSVSAATPSLFSPPTVPRGGYRGAPVTDHQLQQWQPDLGESPSASNTATAAGSHLIEYGDGDNNCAFSGGGGDTQLQNSMPCAQVGVDAAGTQSELEEEQDWIATEIIDDAKEEGEKAGEVDSEEEEGEAEKGMRALPALC